jgi:hypothetical protein
VEAKICLGAVNRGFKDGLGDHNLLFWDYCILFPDHIDDTANFRYGFGLKRIAVPGHGIRME